MTDRLPGAAGHARGGGPALLEREPVVDVLLGAVATAATGHGCAAILTGEAGIGKTSVVRALRASLDHGRADRAVYRRAGRPCPRCGEPIRSRGQGDTNRTAYWCAGCQRGEEPLGA